MKCCYFLLFALAFFTYPAAVSACGYGFVGDCSTNIGLQINGTTDSFAVAPCPGVTSFQGLQLGTIQTLALIRARSINWESCINNVTSATLYYRVYQSGTSGGAWQTLVLEENYFTLAGPYTTRYRSSTANMDLTAGLQVGENYILEAYFRAEIDTIGDDFIPETFIVQNNDGANFHLNFRYGGITAPPFTVVETHKTEPNCFADTTGSVGVAVYGNQSGLFYHWGNINNNFYALYNLAAGIYTVTVTGVNGYSQADTIELGQPAQIISQFNNLALLSCNNGIGQVTAEPAGGAEPYNYQWSNGQNTATLTVTSPGNYALTITDAHGCSSDTTISIPAFSLETTISMASGPLSGTGSATVWPSGGNAPYTFFWNNGSTDSSIYNLLPGSYCVTVMDDTGCNRDTCVTISYFTATGEPQATSLSIWPNPVMAGDDVHLDLPDVFINQEVKMEVYDVSGRLWLQEIRRVGTKTVKFSWASHLPPGLFMLRVNSAGKFMFGRFMAR